jgi:endonuclease/exonuclease/phosphatase family metal-dependent hydrolase
MAKYLAVRAGGDRGDWHGMWGGYDEHLPNLDKVANALIPSEKNCVKGVGPNQCVYVEPFDAPAAAIVDGKEDTDEYYGATEMEFANLGVPGTGRVKVALNKSKTTLRIFAKGLPLPPTSTQVFVALDFSRDEPNATWVDASDIGFEYDIDSGAARRMVPSGAAVNTKWVSSPSTAAWSVKATNLTSTDIGNTRRVDIEFRIPVKGLWGSTDKVVGIAMGTSIKPTTSGPTAKAIGMFPQPTAPLPSSDLWRAPGNAFAKRENYQTLLLGRAPVQPLTYMNWNVKRFTSYMTAVEYVGLQTQNGPGSTLVTSNISSKEIGEFIGAQRADIVGLEEVWSQDAAAELLAAANQRRSKYGLAPYEMVTPPEFSPGVVQLLPKDSLLRFDETHGGTYIFTSQRILQTGSRTYTACQGEDCFKSKGVTWARISTDPPPPPGRCGEGGACQLPPSGDHFVDVFVTHLNAPKSELCKVVRASWQQGLTDLVNQVPGPFQAAITDSYYGCLRTAAAVLHDQVAQLSAYVDQVADPSRPSIVMGDFNLGGKDGTDAGYNDLIKTLKLQPNVTNSAFSAPDVMLNNWPNSWASDIDHADLAREGSSQWVPGEGTDIGRVWTETSPESKRVDYIFVRNPVDRAVLTGANRRHIFLKVPNVPVWTSPWPGPADKSSRLSDHKPVLSTLVLAPYYVPGAYHPTWEQAVEFRITGYDTTGIKDCWTCGQLDVFAISTIERQQGTWATLGKLTSPLCSTYRADGCMDNWSWEDFRSATVTKHRTELELWDQDDSSPNDPVEFADNKTNGFELDWASGEVARQSGGVNTVPGWLKFHDAAPVQGCTRRNIANLCVQWSLREKSPYP